MAGQVTWRHQQLIDIVLSFTRQILYTVIVMMALLKLLIRRLLSTSVLTTVTMKSCLCLRKLSIPRKKQKRPPKRRIFDKNNTNCSTLYEDEELPQRDEVRKSRSLISDVEVETKSPLQRLEQLKELQKRLQERKGLETLTDDAIPDDEFLRSCRALEMCDKPTPREDTTQEIVCSSLPRDSSEDFPFSPISDDLEALEQENIPATVPLTPVSSLHNLTQDNYSQIDLGIDPMEQDTVLEMTYLEDKGIEIKGEPIEIEEPENGFRGFSKEEQESKELWQFQRMFVLQYGRLSPKKLDFVGFPFEEIESTRTIFQLNDFFLNKYLEKYYGIRRQIEPMVVTIEDTESEESQAIEEAVPQLQVLTPLIVSVYSGFDTASGKKLFTSVDKIFKEQTRLQRNEPTELQSIDTLMSSMDNRKSTGVENSIEKEGYVQLLNIETIKPIDKFKETEATVEENVEANAKCDRTVPLPLNRRESVSKVAELPHKNDFHGCGGLKASLNPVDPPGEALPGIDDLFNDKSSEDYFDCLNEISNLKTKRRSLRLNRVESRVKSSVPNATIDNKNWTENCDPILSRISPGRVPEANADEDARPVSITSGCGNNGIAPSVDSPQLRNCNYSPVPNDPSHNYQFPGFVTGNGKTAQISEKAWSTGLAIAEAGKEVEGRVKNQSPLGNVKNLNSGSVRPFTPVRSVDVQYPPGSSRSITDRSSKISEEPLMTSRSTTNPSAPIIGFTTGSGACINLSEAVQEKIKSAMQEFSADLDQQDPTLLELSSIKNKIWSARHKTTPGGNPMKSSRPFTPLKVKKPEPSTSATFGSALGFTTAGGGAIKLSEVALEKMKAGLEAYTPAVDENDLNFSDLSSLKKQVSSNRHKTPSSLLKNNLKLANSEKLPRRSSLPSVSKPFTPLNVRKPENPPQSTPNTFKSVCGFTTAGGGAINLSESVQKKIEADLQAFTAEVEENETLTTTKPDNSDENAPVRAKRKNPPDDVTPFGRKRTRIAGSDLQARMLFTEINEEDDEIIQSSLGFASNIDTENDRILALTVSREVQANPCAFFKDIDKDSNRPFSRWSDTSCPLSSVSRPLEKRHYSFPNKTLNLIPEKKLPLTNQELIPDDIVFDSQEFFDSYEKISTKIKINEVVEKRRTEAIKKQEQVIDTKRRTRERPIPGSLILIKDLNSSTRISLQSLCLPGTSPGPRDHQEFSLKNIDPAVTSITSSTAGNYQFNLEEISRSCVEGLILGDDALLIPNEHNFAGITEFKRSFLASPGVDPTLVPNHWVENHYRWIVWKLASLDRLKFTSKNPPKCLTPDTILKQLKYRYDREIDHAERPVIRRILEKDDAPSRRMVLCVSKIKKTTINNETAITMELTDGWYSVTVALDPAMMNYVLQGKIKEGVKLMTYGSQLMGVDEGCHPLEAPGHIRLKIHTNSTRRVKWYTKLGLQKYSGPMEISLRHIHPNGGLIGKVSGVVSRLYPIVYRESTANGQTIFRNARSEERAQMSLEHSRSSLSRRDVTPCLKMRITDGTAHAVVTIWQNAEECSEMFKEGNSISIVHGTASGKRSNELQISATRWTTFDVRALGKKLSFPERIFTPLSDAMTLSFTPHYGEFDTVGIVVSIGPAPHGMKNFETVYLAWRNDQGDDSFLSILFWEGVASYGYSDIATIGSIVCCVNCEWRRNTYRSIPTAFCTERTVITRNPKQGSHLRNEFESLEFRIGNVEDYVEECARRIQEEVMKKSSSTPGNTSGVLTPKDRRSAAIKGRLEKLQGYGPVPKLSPINLPGSSRVSLDFKSPFSGRR
uniref:Brca2 protein n=1 Tax=Fopius arisanus TaxID=64838 RepID=A0A0C9QNW4_9HYME